MTVFWRCLSIALGAALLILTGCAFVPATPAQPDTPATSWRGRLSLRLTGDQDHTAFNAGFELSGNAQSGELALFTPLGTTLAMLSWSPAAALLRADGSTQRFDTLSALARHALKTDLPVAALFDWLALRPGDAPGWQADLSQMRLGHLTVRRATPLPAAELRLILEN